VLIGGANLGPNTRTVTVLQDFGRLDIASMHATRVFGRRIYDHGRPFNVFSTRTASEVLLREILTQLTRERRELCKIAWRE
jgi:hypothetical protein